MSTRDALDTRVLISVPNPAEAAAIVQALTDAGIQSTSDGNGVVGFQVEAPAMIRVLVHEEDYVRARQILEESRDDAEAINWDQVDIGVPEEE